MNALTNSSARMPTPLDGNIASILDSYLLVTDVRHTTAAFYRRTVRVFESWSASLPSPAPFNARSLSLFLSAMQALGKSAYYRRSLRSGLIALLRFTGDESRVRTVKLDELEPKAWHPGEVASLIAAAPGTPPRDDSTYWQTLIAAAYFTGLSQCDLERMSRSHVTENGTVTILRSRTGKRAITWLPPALLETRPERGPLWPRKVSGEMFRRHFKNIVRKAGLAGTFKWLRKTSGTEADRAFPGQGHEHLANTRSLFERHYNARRADREPLRLPPLPITEEGVSL